MRFRTLKRGSKTKRVSGGCTEWLCIGQDFPDSTQREEHMAIDLKNLQFDRRDDARTFLLSQPNGPEFVRMEGDVPPGESAEPPIIY